MNRIKAFFPVAMTLVVMAVTTTGANVLPPDWDARKAGDKVLAGLMVVTAANVKGAHDAEMVIVNDRAFIVYEANDMRPGESAAWPFVYVALSVVNLKPMQVEKVIQFAKSGQVFTNDTLPAGA